MVHHICILSVRNIRKILIKLGLEDLFFTQASWASVVMYCCHVHRKQKHFSYTQSWVPCQLSFFMSVKTCRKAENDEARSRNDEAKGVPGRRGVTEGDGTMWQRFDEEEKCWRVWGRQKTGVIRRWRTWPQLMCCALACGTRCPLISGARKSVRMTKNKARMYRF